MKNDYPENRWINIEEKQGLWTKKEFEEKSESRDGESQYRQKRAPMWWQVALILFILPSSCYQIYFEK